MAFNPHTQNVTFLAFDGMTEIAIPLKVIDYFMFDSFSVCISYGTQIGTSILMLLTVLIMTEPSKLRRPSSILHVLGLITCTIRMVLLALYFPSPFNEFYNVWAYDYSTVPDSDYAISVASTIMSLLLVIVIEAALVNQAWTMVSLWTRKIKLPVFILSVLITLHTIAWRLVFTVFQVQGIMGLSVVAGYGWTTQWMIVTNAFSIFWFCALFNAKLVLHLVTNRGVLPSYNALTPMEILVMTNGVLMVVPVIFSAMQWTKYTNFEAASWALTSVAIILPLGTLAAQRMTNRSSNVYYPSDSNGTLPVSKGRRWASAFKSSDSGSATMTVISSGKKSQTDNLEFLSPMPSPARQDSTEEDENVRVNRHFEQRVEWA